MKSILLIGLGRFGRHIAIKLDELHHQVILRSQIPPFWHPQAHSATILIMCPHRFRML